MKKRYALALVLSVLSRAQSPEPRSRFHVKYVAEGAAYLDGGRGAGLSDGMKLTLRRSDPPSPNGPAGDAATLVVVSVAEASAVCEVQPSGAEIRAGDEAILAAEDLESIRATRSFAGGRQYAQVVTFTEGDPLDEEARESVPRPPSPEVNRVRGRIGFDYSTIRDSGAQGFESSQFGVVFRGDVTRIGGSFWNLSGYWRGRRNVRSGGLQPETLTDLLNRTYHLTLSYNNPLSRWRAGFGRFYLPWASSLSTIDGGYLGRQYGKHVTIGLFAGSTPDPTSWNYNPNRQMLGTFVNYEGGSFDSVRFSSTTGVAISRIRWRPERQFAFLENGLFFKRYVSIYHNLEADQFRNRLYPDKGVRLSRSFLTLRLQPVERLTLDFSHNYFRDLPTFDPRLIGTGLLDKLLFQGLSAGFRLGLPLRLTAYANVGKSSRTGDEKRSLNYMYGLTMNRIWRTGLRADGRYSRFDSAFGRGTYRALSLSREVGEVLRFEAQAGEQNFVSALSGQNRARFVNGNVDWFLGTHYFLGGGYTVYRGPVQHYDQMFMNLGYRF